MSQNISSLGGSGLFGGISAVSSTGNVSNQNNTQFNTNPLNNISNNQSLFRALLAIIQQILSQQFGRQSTNGSGAASTAPTGGAGSTAQTMNTNNNSNAGAIRNTSNLSGPIILSGMDGLRRYISAVDNNGNIDNTKIHGGITNGVGAVSTYDARTSIIEGYASEFYSGGRISDPNFMAQMTTALWRDFNSSKPADRDAANFALTAARYKNAGGNYSNANLAALLKDTNNIDLLADGVGETDVETLAAITSAIKRGTLTTSHVFDFDRGTDSRNQKSVADTDKYRNALNAVRSGNLGDSIANGPVLASAGATPRPIPFTYNLNQTQVAPITNTSNDNRNIDFSALSSADRSQLGMTARERAILHLWGRQLISAGQQDGGIYTNVLGADGSGANWANKDEVALIQELRAAERQQFGGDTGIFLDQLYFQLVKDKTGVDLSARYANRPVHFSTGAVQITSDINTLRQRTGLSEFEQGVMRLFGHDPLINGRFDGSVLEYTVGNNNALDGQRNSSGNPVDATAQQLLREDLQDDGQRNGSSLLNQTVSILDRLYAANLR